MKSGIYIVTLNNDQPISVNANDPRIAEKAIKVTKMNCKVGKAKNLTNRKNNYFKVFGEHNVNFRPLVRMVEIDQAEKAVLARLDQHRIRGNSGRKNEWLQNITSNELCNEVLSTLTDLGLPFELIEQSTFGERMSDFDPVVLTPCQSCQHRVSGYTCKAFPIRIPQSILISAS